MDPKFNDQWSTSEIRMVKSLIASHNANNNYTDDTNKKHSDIVNEIQARLPWKGRHKVVEMYVEIVVEMISMQSAQGGNLSMVATLNNFNDNFGIPVENQTMDNMDMSLAYLTDEQPEAMKVVVEVPQSQVIIPQQEGLKKERSWTIEEHRKFLQGLRQYGRGSWKKISRDFVTTKTPVQISSHAQKYFRRQERTSEKKRHSINDVGLNDAEFGVQNNSSSWEALAFAGGVYNPNCYGFDGQLAAVNNHGQVWPPFPFCAGQASSSNQATTWTGQQIEAGSYAAPTPEEAGSQMAFNGDHQGDFLPSNGCAE